MTTMIAVPITALVVFFVFVLGLAFIFVFDLFFLVLDFKQFIHTSSSEGSCPAGFHVYTRR